MANTQLDAYLKGDAAEPEPTPATTVDATTETAPQADVAAKPAAEADDAEPPEPAEGEAVVPRRALEDERHKRQDWKRQAVEAQTQRDELRKQLEEAKRAAPQPQPVQQQPIDPTTHPQEFVQRIQGVVLNERLNVSEMLMRKELGAEKVDTMIAEFKQAAQTDPTLFTKLYAQPHPYEWAAKQVERIALQRDIGDDPAAYRAKLRAEFEAEAAAANPAVKVSPAAGMAPSLATARSVAGRSAPAFTGPPSLDDIIRRN